MRTIENQKEFRDNIRYELYKILSTNDDNKKSKTLNSEQRLAYNLEVSIYNYVIKEATNLKVHKKWNNPYFVELYINRLRSMYMNLHNENFKMDIINKNITVEKLVYLNHHELNPERWKIPIEKKNKKRYFEI